jgi:predicted Zn-dependent protease with MMP-like domain
MVATAALLHDGRQQPRDLTDGTLDPPGVGQRSHTLPCVSAPLRRRRDRRGHGLRGPLLRSGTGDRALDRAWGLPPIHLAAATRAQIFDDLVLDAVELLERRWADRLADVEFGVEEVPLLPPLADPGLNEEDVPLSRIEAPTRTTGGRIVIYRRPLEARSHDQEDLADLVLDVVIHQVGELLGIDLGKLDPEGHGD